MATRNTKKGAKKQRAPRGEAPAWARGLHPRWRAFIEHYLTNGFNATRAYIAAGYKPDNAAVSASQLLRNPKVAAALKLALADALMSADELRARISDDATASMLDFVSVEDGRIKHDWQRAHDTGALRHLRKLTIKDTEHGREVRFEIVDDQKAKDQLAKMMGLYSESRVIKGDPNAPLETRTTHVVELETDDLDLDDARALRDKLLAQLALQQGEDAGDK